MKMLAVARFKAEEALTSFTLLVIADETTGLRTGPSLLVTVGRWYVVMVWDCIFQLHMRKEEGSCTWKAAALSRALDYR